MNSLLIESGAELAHWTPTYVEVQGRQYTVLTGYEGPIRRCFWCGGELKGKLKRYCRGHMTLYYRYFEWGSASRWALERAGHRCENCGKMERGRRTDTGAGHRPGRDVTNMKVIWNSHA